jgi:hypothetical protein
LAVGKVCANAACIISVVIARKWKYELSLRASLGVLEDCGRRKNNLFTTYIS